MGADAGEIVLLEKSQKGTRDAASNWDRDWQEHVKNQGYQMGFSSKSLFRQEGHQVSGMTHDNSDRTADGTHKTK